MSHYEPKKSFFLRIHSFLLIFQNVENEEVLNNQFCNIRLTDFLDSIFALYVLYWGALMCLALTGTRSSNFFYHPLAKSLTFRVSRSEGRFRRRSRLFCLCSQEK
mgnify:CR=1 FL=1